MTQYKPYAEYKESGVEWMPKIPRHWNSAQLRRVVTIFGGTTPSSENEGYWNGPHAWVTPPDLSTAEKHTNSRVFQTQRTLTNSGLAVMNRPLAPSGSLILSTRAPIGTLAISAVPSVSNQGCKTLITNKKLHPSFLFYHLSSNKHVLQSLGRGSTFLELSQEHLSSFEIQSPPLPEQQAIANFLDRETERIDALIQKKSKFIELLEEKRQALISHAVTKGLNPDAPMKDSGVPWLGEVPAHWTVLRFQRIVNIRSGQVRTSDSSFLEQILIAPNHIESRTGRLFSLETARAQNAISGKYQAEEGDVIYSKIRPALRKACLAPMRSLCSADMYALDASPRMENEFLLYFLLSEPFSAFAVLEADRVAMPKINRDSLNSIHMAVPPKEEQLTIVQSIQTSVKQIDNVRNGVTHSITLLREKRSALITAAVTGQIDVREEVLG